MQSRSEISDLQHTTATTPEPTVRPISTSPTPWALTNLIALSKGSGCYSLSTPQSLLEDYHVLLDSLREKGAEFVVLDISYDLDAYLHEDIKRLSLCHIDAHVKDLMAKVKTKSGKRFRQIAPKTDPDAGTQVLEALCWNVKSGPLDPRTLVLGDLHWAMKRLGLNPDLRESDIVKTPEMLLSLTLGLTLAQIGAVVAPDTPILSVCDDIIDQHCALTDLLPPPRHPPPPPRRPLPPLRHPPPPPQYPPPTTPLHTILYMLVLSQALWMIPFCLAIHCLSTSTSRWF